MRVDHPQLNKRDRRAEPSFWVEEPTDDALSLLENALRGDEPALRRDEQADEAHSLIEENARLRELLSQLSDIIRKNGVHRDNATIRPRPRPGKSGFNRCRGGAAVFQ